MNSKQKGRPLFLVATDLDHTLVQNEDPTHKHLLQFDRIWNHGPVAHSLLVFSTGRSPVLFQKLWNEAPLLLPDIMICSVGTEIYYRSPDGSRFEPDEAWLKHLDQNWNRAKALAIANEVPELKPQAESEQRRHKLSFHLETSSDSRTPDQVIDALRASLKQAGIAAKVIYSGGVDVDVISEGAGKGFALRFLLQQLKARGVYPQLGVQVNGDSGNDIELFEVEGVQGCVVANAHPELDAFYKAHPSPQIYKSTLPCSGGIVEALKHFGTLEKLQQHPLNSPLAAATAAMLVPSPQQPSQAAPTPHSNSTSTQPACMVVNVDGAGALVAASTVIMDGDAAGSEAGGRWVDRVLVNELAPGVLLVSGLVYGLNSEGLRDCESVERVTVAVQQRENGNGAAGGEGFVVRHMQRQAVGRGSVALAVEFA